MGIWPVADVTTWGICFATFANAHKLSEDHAEAGALGPGARGAGHVEVGVVGGGEGEGEGKRQSASYLSQSIPVSSLVTRSTEVRTARSSTMLPTS